ncbi:hypothetical protein BU26DRAFT_506947 [Trematosphaeria pertusa]|uniref:Uncharacterized protein n=1 Tax=Trematosphaeria pertusa TaxID=390896 RepID=A0A6A6IC30_9PLEO|nr:uncharacterized protein BU26DRAFT_506947 [Trematosphaeria pertusa]KAF2247767.1 hypothetical protein BU26DRAFT_506947 [Trematosphaeria pertusa]
MPPPLMPGSERGFAALPEPKEDYHPEIYVGTGCAESSTRQAANNRDDWARSVVDEDSSSFFAPDVADRKMPLALPTIVPRTPEIASRAAHEWRRSLSDSAKQNAQGGTILRHKRVQEDFEAVAGIKNGLSNEFCRDERPHFEPWSSLDQSVLQWLELGSGRLRLRHDTFMNLYPLAPALSTEGPLDVVTAARRGFSRSVAGGVIASRGGTRPTRKLSTTSPSPSSGRCFVRTLG